MSAVTLARPAPGARTLNDLPWKPYTYQGSGVDTLTPEIDAMPDEAFAPLPDTGREPAGPGTDGHVRRHYREKTPLCEACRQHESRRTAERAAADLASGKTVWRVHSGRGGRPWCGARSVLDDVKLAAPGQEVTCGRCNRLRGKA